MIWTLLAFPLAALCVAALWVRRSLHSVEEQELAKVEFAFEALDELFQTRHGCLPELISVCHVFTDYESGTLVRLHELHEQLLGKPAIADRIVLENAVSEFLRDLVNTIDAHPELTKNVFLQQLLERIHRAEARISDRRSSVNLRVDEYNQALTRPIVERFGKIAGLAPLRRLDMTAQELLRATRPFSSCYQAVPEPAATGDAALESSARRAKPSGPTPEQLEAEGGIDLGAEPDEFGPDPNPRPELAAKTSPRGSDEVAEIDLDGDMDEFGLFEGPRDSKA